MIFIIFEAVIEIFIPFITANLVNDIKAGTDISEVAKTGAFLIGRRARFTFLRRCGRVHMRKSVRRICEKFKARHFCKNSELYI